MRKLMMLTAVVLLSVAPQALLAQHAGHDMGGMGGMTGMNHDDSQMKQMQKMMTMQASDEQKSHFLAWNRSTTSVKQALTDLRQAVAASNYSSQLEAFKAAVGNSVSGHEEFSGSLNQEQQAGLKKRLQKVGKANGDLAAATEIVVRELSQTNGSRNFPAKLDKARKAIDKLLREQQGIASEMGIA